MPDKIVEVIGKGPVAFPDTMSDAEILEVLKRQHTPAKPGIIESFVNRGIETAKGVGSLALDAAKSATTLEGQATFLPRLAKGMYEGAVDAGAGAITRQFPKGVDNLPESELLTGAARAGAAAVPVIGPYVMNKVSDIEEGNARKVIGETLFDAVTAGAAKGTPKAAPPALAKMRAMGGELALDARDVARSKIWGPAMGGAIGAAVGGSVGSAVGLGAELIYSTRYARKAKAEKALAKAAKAAEADSIKAATTEVRLIESAEKNSAKATKLAETDSMKSGGIEARILEASQKTQAAVQQELAVATERVRVATVKNRAKAEADLHVAQAKAEAAAKRVADAQERAEAAQIRREYRQRTQLDRQAAKAAKSSPAPASAAQQPVSAAPATPPAFTEMVELTKPANSAPDLTKARKSANQMVYSTDKSGNAYSVEAIADGLRRTYKDLPSETAAQIAKEVKAKAVHPETVAGGLAGKDIGISQIAEHLHDTYGIPTSKAVEAAFKEVQARGTAMTKAQRAEYLALKGKNLKKIGLDLKPRS